MSVVAEHPERLNLTGLVLMSLLEQNLHDESMRARAGRLQGKVGIQAGRMRVTVHCDSGRFVISNGFSPDLRAKVSGPMDVFLQVPLGKNVYWLVVTGRLRIGGNPFFLLKLLPLMRVHDTGRK
jgi:hypothetical protein